MALEKKNHEEGGVCLSIIAQGSVSILKSEGHFGNICLRGYSS